MNRTFQTFLLCTTLLGLSACRSREGVPNTVTDNHKPFSLQQSTPGNTSSVVVKDEETVYSIAYAHGVTSHAIIAINDLSPPYALKPGQVIQLPSPGEHVVREGESFESIAAIYGISAMVLAQENQLDMGSPLHRRQRLIVPAKDTKPAVLEATAAAAGTPLIAAKKLDPVGAPTPHNTIGHEAHRGENRTETRGGTFAGASAAASLANELPSDLASELAQEKGSKSNGQTAGKTVAAAAAAAPILVKEPSSGKKADAENMTSSTSIPPIAPSKPLNTIAPQESSRESKAAVAEGPAKEPAKLASKAAAASTNFSWPLKGQTVAKFGDKVTAGKNDGLNIKAPIGTPVKAAADGTVVYAGSELKGFGNLVLIKHKDGWMTAYGHNSVIDVKKGQAVKQGDAIAKVGKTGDVNEPQLHFEIRKGTQPIDPMSKLGS